MEPLGPSNVRVCLSLEKLTLRILINGVIAIRWVVSSGLSQGSVSTLFRLTALIPRMKVQKTTVLVQVINILGDMLQSKLIFVARTVDQT